MMVRASSRLALRILPAVVTVLLSGGLASAGAQVSTAGGFLGTVQDASGAILPGATVTAIHVTTNVRHSTVADSEGRFRIPSLPLGEYRLEVAMDGFQTDARTGLILTVARNIEVHFRLQVGAAETVTVTGAAALVDTTSSTVVGRVGGEEIRALPLNARGFDQLISLSAGTVHFSERLTNVARGTGRMFSTAGARPNTSQFLVDGAEFSGAGAINTSLSSASGRLLGVEGIQEFAVITNSGDASVGKKPGGQISIVTRSGTNAFRGTGYEFLRNDRLDARNFFDVKEEPTPPLSQHNFGGALGGPISRDRAFFFANFERFRERRNLTIRGIVPTAEVRQGRFPDGSVFPVHPDIRPLLDLFPEPRGRDFGDGTAESIEQAERAVDDSLVIARVDHSLGGSDSLFGRYITQYGLSRDPNDGYGLFREEAPFRNQLVTTGYKKILTSNLLNTATFAYNRSHLSVDHAPADGVPVLDAMMLVPGQTRHGGIATGSTASGAGLFQLPTLGGSGTLGSSGRFVTRQVFQVSNRVEYSAGRHHVQTGAEVHRILSTELQGAQMKGFLEFANLESFVQGRPRRIRGPQPGSDAFRDWRQYYVALYAQDSYGIARNLTLNYGLRWEYMSNPYDVEGRTTAFVPEGNRIDGAPLPDEPPVVPRAFAENKSGNFAPRLGFAWDLFGSGRTSLRGGFGLFYGQIENEFRRANAAAAPFYNRVSVNNPPFPNPGQALADGSLGRLSPLGLHQAPEIPVITQYNLRLEQALGERTVVAVAYVGSRGRNLVREGNPQVPPPFLNADGRWEFPQTIVSPQHDTNAAFLVWDAHSWYDSLQIELDRRLTAGLQFKVAFTLSKALDESVDNNSAPLGMADKSTVMHDPSFDKGLAPHHVGRRLSVNWSYELPFGRRDGLAGLLLNQWGIAGIFQAQDGFPFSVLTGSGGMWAPRNLGVERPDLAPGASANPVLGGPERYFDVNAFQQPPPGVIGNVGMNTLRAPGLALMDISVIKKFALPNGTNLEFRWDTFNLLNRANFGTPNNVLFNPDGSRRGAAGRITNTVTTAREMQIGVKFNF